MVKVVILRGISGAGKTTYMEETFERPGMDAVSVSADHYMVDADGRYAFNPQRLPECHAQCLKRFLALVQSPLNDSVEGSLRTIVVDNTNTTLWEVSPYVSAALAYGHEVKVITFLCDPKVAFKRSRHGIPAKNLVEMAIRLQESTAEMPSWWKQEVRFT